MANSSYRPSFQNHSFYHGYWNGNWGGLGYGGYGRFGGPFGYGYGFGPWGYGGYGMGFGGLGFGGLGGYGGYFGYPLGWGLGAWGLGSLMYGSGYLGYSNPYYGGGGGGSFGGYNYSQPIPVDYGAQAAAVTTDTSQNPADAMLNDAIAAFKQGDYDAALDIVNRAITQYPSDAVLHEFRALVLFAKADYQQAAATLHSVLAVGPGWDWTTLSTLYPNVSVYTDQLRALEAFVRSHPQDGAARFVLAYHYITLGHADAAARQLSQVVQLVSNDKLANSLLMMLKPPSQGQGAQPGQPGQPAAEQPTPRPPEEATPTGPAVDPAKLVGSWKAAREDGSKFELTLANDSTFTWKFSQAKQKPQEFSGKYTLEGNVLALERKDGGSLVGQVSFDGDKKFKFKAVGGPPEDPGLDFAR